MNEKRWMNEDVCSVWLEKVCPEKETRPDALINRKGLLVDVRHVPRTPGGYSEKNPVIDEDGSS